jgi:hypothetical protein
MTQIVVRNDMQHGNQTPSDTTASFEIRPD